MLRNFKSILVVLLMVIGFASCRNQEAETVEEVAMDTVTTDSSDVILVDSVDVVTDTLVVE